MSTPHEGLAAITPLGSTGLRVSRLGFGAMRLPYVLVDNAEVILSADATRLIHGALDRGINLIDTAHSYSFGKSEMAVGEALAGRDRNRYVLSSKVMPGSCSSRADFRRLFTLSLERLRVSYLDILFAHNLSWGEWESHMVGVEMAREMAELRDRGDIRHMFFSSHDAPENVDHIIDTGMFEGVLLQYNMIDRSYAPCLARAKAKGMATMVMGPIGGGNLSGDIKELSSVIVSTGCRSLPELALRYVFDNRDVDCVLSGMSTSAMVDENVRIARDFSVLSEEARRCLDEACTAMRRRFSSYCTWCKYCMPCPAGVHIPLNLKAYGLFENCGARAAAARLYERIGVDPLLPGNRASACLSCAECEANCPQGLPIMNIMKRLADMYGR